MAQSKNTSSQEFDTLIIGGGLSGLLVAHQLEGTGRRIAIVEALDILGGNCRPYVSPIGPIDHGLKFFPATTAARDALEWVETILGRSLDIQELDAPPVTFDNGKFQPFVGFGDFSPEAASELDYFSTPKRFVTSLTPKDWVPILSEGFTGSVFLQSHVTRLQFDDGFIIEATLNGVKKVSAREYVYCASPQGLAPLLPEAAISARQRGRLTKGKFFTAIGLDMVHGQPITDSRALHMLKGANEEPLVGVFHPPTAQADGKNVQHSQWLTFVPADQTEDNEVTATALKKIKRQVKRAYETSLDALLFERILIAPGSHGEISGLLTNEQRWPKIDNLWAAGAFFSSNRNLVGSIEQCRRVLDSIGEPIVEADVESPKPNTPTILA